MAFKFNSSFEDLVTERVFATFADLPEGEFSEPIHMTNDRLAGLADALGDMAREAGCLVQFSTPNIKDKWREGHPSTYTVEVTWLGVAGRPSFFIPILPRDAA